MGIACNCASTARFRIFVVAQGVFVRSNYECSRGFRSERLAYFQLFCCYNCGSAESVQFGYQLVLLIRRKQNVSCYRGPLLPDNLPYTAIRYVFHLFGNFADQLLHRQLRLCKLCNRSTICKLDFQCNIKLP